jgi:glycosyltransferase involved in cell wall biosynthesis
MRLSIVLWDGNLGGAEKVTAELAGALRRVGVDATVVFVRDPATLAADLERLEVPYVSFGATRVEEVLLRPHRFARLVEARGPDGALLPAVGHQAPALRIGGYRAPLIAVEHGFLLLIQSMSPHWRLARRLERRLSAPFVDAEIAVSKFMHSAVMRAPHARRVEQIRNGIDVARYVSHAEPGAGSCVIGCASRLVPGKGIETLISAFERIPGAHLRIAGEGPEREQLAAAAPAGVEFLGVVDDMPAFWAGIDVAVMPSTLQESFGMAALEAMASGKPVVATRCGGVEELVRDGMNGRLVPTADQGALAEALRAYVDSPELRREHGEAGRRRCEDEFSIEGCATAYATVFAELAGVPLPGPARHLEEVHA